MTLFEYLAIAISIMFSMSAMRLISGLPHALQPGRRYWVHSIFVSFHLMVTVVVFWNYWNFASHVSWTLPQFVMALASPAFVYLNACALIPERADAIQSWKDYYFSVSRRYFVGVGAWMIVNAGTSSVFLDTIPLFHLHPARLVQLAVLVACVVGASSRSPKVHAGLATGSAGGLLFSIFFVFSDPGGLVSSVSD